MFKNDHQILDKLQIFFILTGFCPDFEFENDLVYRKKTA